MLIGAATNDITPPPGVRLSGFAGRPSGNTGVRDPLRASVLYVEDENGVRALVVALDIIGLSSSLDERFRQELGAAVNSPPDNVLVACSHTHSGPATMPLRATGDYEERWTETILERAVHAAGAAQNAARPARVFHTEGTCFANINRRRPTERGVTLGPNPSGPVDHTCRMILFKGRSGPVAALVHFAMHPVSLGPGNLMVSADWVTSMRETIEEILGCPTLFLQGCCGDVNPRTRGDDSITDSLGLSVAGSVLSSMGAGSDLSDARLACGAAPVDIPVRPLASEAELETVLSTAQNQTEKLGLEPGVGNLAARHMAEANAQWAEACRQTRRSGAPPTSIPARVSAIRFGSVTLVGLPGEIFTEIGDRIRQEVPGAWPVGYANGNHGYLYPDSALAEGGYEVDVAFRLYGEFQAGPGTADALVNAARAASDAAR